ncbi:DUF4032 domain-containing protein [Oscillochloris sp. ZM17-4]|uniref:DUF4032 domain-containing protein n=1 Tax=Oscillochloris sp. ZM17-4 TaxID=2866714 RepID=UPI001C72E323|nr:DUF4032 domain-containing protein [Oscillochloris sp. ZM17-4]MBX0329158.1 DUF4032 domain-containing protein [Oscillochloris sp. ZM17-4]
MSWVSSNTREDFHKARRSAFIAQLLTIITRSSNELLPFEEVRARLHVRGQHYLGHQTVLISTIIGSEGRYADFDRRFAPRTDATRFRWMSVDRAYYEDVGLPAVDLYKLGDIYFVKDGHHRISVARQRGQIEIDAIVTELTVDVPLTPDLDMRSMLLKEEYSDFLAWTNLAELCPGQLIEFSEPGGYLDLVRHINAHRYYMGLERDRPVDRDEAVVSWYNEVYRPVAEVLREQQALRFFPGRTEADLYRWIMDHRWYLRERNGGADPGPLVAVADYVRLFGRRSMAELTERLMRGLRTMTGATPV